MINGIRIRVGEATTPKLEKAGGSTISESAKTSLLPRLWTPRTSRGLSGQRARRENRARESMVLSMKAERQMPQDKAPEFPHNLD
ncbi:MAG TPA: hypothetical protein DCP63_11445 [Bacteroidetes bacterium]|nr:hypothetical protein [Bacteroidota bacterium]